MTRRSLLGAGAGAAAGALIGPSTTLGALVPALPRLSERRLGKIGPTPRTIALSGAVDLLGLQWRGTRAAQPQVRWRLGNGRWGAWTSAAGHGHGPEGHGAGAAVGAGTAVGAGAAVGDPVWTGGTRELQLRAPAVMHDVRLRLVDVSDGVGARRAASGPLAALLATALPSAAPTLDAGPGQPAIISRRAWALNLCHPRVTPEYGDVRLAFVHHTENPNGYSAGEVPAMLRAIYAFHRFVNGWDDIGYNFVVDLYGRIWEARAGGIDEAVVGAHAGGYNLHSSGVAVLGSFMGTPISPAAGRALQRLLAWKLSLHGVPVTGRVTVRVNPAGAAYSRFPANAPVSLPRVAGHRDGDSTDCPGNVLYGQLPSIRRRTAKLAGRAVQATLALVPAPPAEAAPAPAPAEGSPPSPPPPAQPPVALATLSLLDGTPLPGLPVALQARTVARRGEAVAERTVAEGVTDAQGRWTVPTALPLAPKGQWVRALFPGAGGYGAGVSAAVRITPPPSPPPAPAPSAPAPAPPTA